MVKLSKLKKQLDPYKHFIVLGVVVVIYIIYVQYYANVPKYQYSGLSVSGQQPGDTVGAYIETELHKQDWVGRSYNVTESDTADVVASNSKYYKNAKLLNMPTTFTDKQCVAACKAEKAHFANISRAVPDTLPSCNCYKTQLACIKVSASASGSTTYSSVELSKCPFIIQPSDNKSTSSIYVYPNCSGDNVYADDESKICKVCTAPTGKYVTSCDRVLVTKDCKTCPPGSHLEGCQGINPGRCMQNPKCKKFETYDKNTNRCRSVDSCPINYEPNDNANGCYPCQPNKTRKERELLNVPRTLVYDQSSRRPVYVSTNFQYTKEWGYLIDASGKKATMEIKSADNGSGFKFQRKSSNAKMNDIFDAEVYVATIDDETGIVVPMGNKVTIRVYNKALSFMCI